MQQIAYYIFMVSLPFAAAGFLVISYLSLLYVPLMSMPRYRLLTLIPNTKKNRALIRFSLASLSFFLAAAAFLNFASGGQTSVTALTLFAAVLLSCFHFFPIGLSVLSSAPRTQHERIRTLLIKLGVVLAILAVTVWIAR